MCFWRNRFQMAILLGPSLLLLVAFVLLSGLSAHAANQFPETTPVPDTRAQVQYAQPTDSFSFSVPEDAFVRSSAWPAPTPTAPARGYEDNTETTDATTLDMSHSVEDTTYPVVDHPASQEYPCVSGDLVFWQDTRSGPADIFMKDLSSGKIENLTSSQQWEIHPDSDGTNVVWRDGYDGIGIHGMNLSSREVFTVTVGKHDVSRPRISNAIVVWADDRRGEWDVYGFDLVNQEEFVISDSPGDQRDPNIDGDTVVWWDGRNGDRFNEHIYAYRLSTQSEEAVATNPGDKEYPDVWNDIVVWLDSRNGSWDVFAYDLTTKQERPIVVQPGDQRNATIGSGLVAWEDSELGTSDIYLYSMQDDKAFPVSRDSGMQTLPATDGNTLVWQDNRNHQWDIYAFDWTGTVPPAVEYAVVNPKHLQVGAFPERRIGLRWEDDSDNELGFSVERAQGITGTNWSEITSLPVGTTIYTDIDVIADESYWYRVRAFNESGRSAFSNESFNSAFVSVPNQDEMYLLTLINEARADPGTFGYPSYEPVPPLVYNPLLNYSAHSHSQSILNSIAQIGHCDDAGRCPTDRAQAVGYTGQCAENLVLGEDGPESVKRTNQSFMDSEGHRNNMLAPDLVEVGIGHAHRENMSGEQIGQYTEVFCGRAGVEIPAAPSGAVIPYVGEADTVFTYTVNFWSVEGDTPSSAEVFIDREPHPLVLSTGKAAHGTYRFTTTLPAAPVHEYYFLFRYGDGGTARWPSYGAVNGPEVGPMRLAWYVDGSVSVSGDGLSPETAVKTIQEVMDRVDRLDTIQLAAGEYSGQVILPEGATIRGAGVNVTLLESDCAGGTTISAGSESLIEGLTIQGYQSDGSGIGVWISGQTVRIRDSRITGHSIGVYSDWNGSDPTTIRGMLSNVVVDHNKQSGVAGNDRLILEIENSTLVHNGDWGIVLNSPESRAANDIIAHNGAGGLANYGQGEAHHNLFWMNGNGFADPVLGPGDLMMDPMFRDGEQGDYRLSAGSPAIGRGDPVGTDLGAMAFGSVGNPPTGLKIVGMPKPRLEWEHADASAFNIYWGESSGLYLKRLPVNGSTTLALAELPGATDHYVAVSALDSEGNETALSSELHLEVDIPLHSVYLPMIGD